MCYLPYRCPECGTDLQEPGAIISWFYQPERAFAHLEPGEEDGVVVVLDRAHEMPEISLQCFECGADIQFLVEEICLDEDFEGSEEE